MKILPPLETIRPEIWLTLMIPAVFITMVELERMQLGPAWPEAPRWRLKGALYFLMLACVNGLVAAAVPPSWRRYHLIDGARWGFVPGALAGYALLSLGNAMLHYGYHRFDVLWRWVHQLHHAPARLDVCGVMYQTPFEGFNNAALFIFITVTVLGLEPPAAALCAFLGAFYGMFQHFNVPTPRWLGLLIQRPEAHSLHHRRGRHNWNYSDLPLWDMLCGTFRNPRLFHPGPLGFEPDAAARERDMWLGRELAAPRRR